LADAKRDENNINISMRRQEELNAAKKGPFEKALENIQKL
jgi:hypothetical protein